MDDYIPSPLKDYTPRQPQIARTVQSGITEEVLGKINDLSRTELIDLIKRIGGACWGVGLMDEEQTAQAMLLKLAVNGLTSRDSKDALANITQWLDRKQGKAIQRIDQRVEHNAMGSAKELDNSALLALLASADTAGLLPAGLRLVGGDLVTDASYEDVTTTSSVGQ